MKDPSRPPLPTFINDASAKLLDACLFAHGAFHIELGDDGQMLVNEYFPARTPRMHDGLKQSMRAYYDFAVRYENLLALHDGTENIPIPCSSHALSRQGVSGAIWAVTKIRDDGAIALNLINLNGVDDQWRNVSGNPIPQTNIVLQVRTDRNIQRVWIASPDDGLGRPQELPFQSGQDSHGDFIAFTVPKLTFWDLVWIEP